MLPLAAPGQKIKFPHLRRQCLQWKRHPTVTATEAPFYRATASTCSSRRAMATRCRQQRSSRRSSGMAWCASPESSPRESARRCGTALTCSSMRSSRPTARQATAAQLQALLNDLLHFHIPPLVCGERFQKLALGSMGRSGDELHTSADECKLLLAGHSRHAAAGAGHPGRRGRAAEPDRRIHGLEVLPCGPGVRPAFRPPSGALLI